MKFEFTLKNRPNLGERHRKNIVLIADFDLLLDDSEETLREKVAAATAKLYSQLLMELKANGDLRD